MTTTNPPPDNFDQYAFSTRAVRAGQVRTAEGEHNDPIFTTSSYIFESAAQAKARFAEEEPGNVYSRFTNPTVRTFEQRLAALEETKYCIATASGMAAILTTCLALLKAGDHVVASRNLFGSTVNLFTNILSRFGIETTFVPLVDPAQDIQAWAKAIRNETRMLFLETPANPLTEIADIKALADLAHAHDCLLVVDNVICTPALQKPLTLGADIVIHSATKYLDGQGRCVGGAVVTRTESTKNDVFSVLRTAGASMSPFNAWVFLKGLETLPLRMQAHSASALEIARWLENQPAVVRVYHPGLASHPHHALATSQQSASGGILAFDIQGGREEAWRLIDATRMISITANFGDAKSTITHPATTTHSRLTPEQRIEAGIGESLIRFAAGLEDIEDIKADLERGLDAI
uniref:O-succinylhomoserine sulfhydrylase n=1 Tax=Candidatus Kentrum sp. TUN TaxID=2126343 RepID=A0A450ZXN7_9GAMM|nr:MAG: O-succinylhomoserine sulfhydrylase [Candidatus Kentron sp. TUN]VFK58559.1 MAG: O-succinylhomoserine sulfhydrylase [Candidatus Kentron sp. TUN]VFK61063.1 MAG: O-succinylhomoserine sulfhydrylase [Candidatus Kentron sp. TUN]